MRKGGRPSGLSCGHSQVFHCAACGRCCSAGKVPVGCCFSISASSAASCSLSQGCKTALVTESTPLAWSWPVAGRKSVSSLAVPPRSYSCGCNAGWPSGCHEEPGCGMAWYGPASSCTLLHDPGGLRLLVGLLN